ncbi:MAG: CHAD domain-containing protein [Acidobacteriota bacterium]
MNSFVQQQTAERFSKWREALEGLDKHPDKAKAIHDLRVAIRRLTQCLRIFEAHFDSDEVKRYTKRLHRLMGRCGQARNYDVGLDLLTAAGLGKSSAAMRTLAKGRKAADRNLSAELNKWVGHKRSKEAALPAALEPGKELGNPLAGLTKEFFEAGCKAALAGSSYQDMHTFRVQAKHFRYSVEIFEPRLDAAAVAPVLDSLRELQDKLGEMNDCVAALGLLKHHKRATAILEALLVTREEAFRTEWKRRFNAKKEHLWTSTFSGTAKRSPSPPRSRTRRAA